MKIIAQVEIEVKSEQKQVLFVDQAQHSIRQFFGANTGASVNGDILNFRVIQQDIVLKDIPDPY